MARRVCLARRACLRDHTVPQAACGAVLGAAAAALAYAAF